MNGFAQRFPQRDRQILVEAADFPAHEPGIEFGGRVLRVAVNKAVEPNRVVSVFFDRQMKGKL